MNAFHKSLRMATVTLGLAGLGIILQFAGGPRSDHHVAVAQSGGSSGVAYDVVLNPSCGPGASSYQIDIPNAAEQLACPPDSGYRWAVVLTKCPSCTAVTDVTVTAGISATGQSETLPVDANGVAQRNGCASWLPDTFTIATNGCPIRSARIVLGCCTASEPPPPPPPPPSLPPPCSPVICDLWCACGFITDPDGCEICACRTCTE